LAYYIDLSIVVTASFVMMLILKVMRIAIDVFFPLYICCFLGFFSTSGQTLGARALGIKVAREDGNTLNFKNGIIRIAEFLI
jgi:uncharacterized RDD family membrane protein YckC